MFCSAPRRSISILLPAKTDNTCFLLKTPVNTLDALNFELPQWCVDVTTMSESPPGGLALTTLMYALSLVVLSQCGFSRWLVTIFLVFRYWSTQVTDSITVTLHQNCLLLISWEPSNNSRQVGIANPGGNTKKRIALSASFDYAHRVGVARLQSRTHKDQGVKVDPSYLYHVCCFPNPFWSYLTPDHLQGRAPTSYTIPAPLSGYRGASSAVRNPCNKGKSYRLAHTLYLVISSTF